MVMNPTRRRLVQGAAAATLLPVMFVRRGWAQGKSLQIGIYGGPQGEYMRKQVIPRFETDHGCRVFADEGVTLSQIARLRATRENPKFSVMFMDDVGVEIAKREGLIDPLPRARIAHLERVTPRFVFNDGYGVAFAISTIGLTYNPRTIKPITSYAELWEPRFRRRLALVTPKYTQSVFFVIATAAIVTGKPYAEAQRLADQAWPKLQELKPNVMSIFEATGAVPSIVQGEADIGALEFSKSVYPYKLKGANVDLCFPREGAFAGINCMTLVKGAPEPELAAAFMDHMLDPAVQQPMSAAMLTAPPITGLEFKPDVAQLIAYPEARMDELGLFTGDWDYLNPLRSAWVEKLNQIFVTG